MPTCWHNPTARRTVLLDSCCSPVPAAQPLPLLWVNRQRGGFAGRQVEKRSVVVDRAVPEEPAQQRLPLFALDRQRGGFRGREVENPSVEDDRAVPEEPAQQRQRLGGKRLVHERLLQGERLQGAAARIAQLLFGDQAPRRP